MIFLLTDKYLSVSKRLSNWNWMYITISTGNWIWSTIHIFTTHQKAYNFLCIKQSFATDLFGTFTFSNDSVPSLSTNNWKAYMSQQQMYWLL